MSLNNGAPWRPLVAGFESTLRSWGDWLRQSVRNQEGSINPLEMQTSQSTPGEQLDGDPIWVGKAKIRLNLWMRQTAPIMPWLRISDEPWSVPIWQQLLMVGGILVGTLVVVFSYVGPITHEMDWTGFCGNTLWDWLDLLFVPVALGIVAPAYARYHESPHPRSWRPRTIIVVTVVAIATLAFLALSYALHWPIAGLWARGDGSEAGLGQCMDHPDSAMQPRKLWDWFTVLLLPLSVAAATIQFKQIQERAIESRAATGAASTKAETKPPEIKPPEAN
jgi:hypothetical protein